MLRHRRAARAGAALVVSGLCVWYILARIDFHETADVLSSSNPWQVAAAFAILVLALLPLSWRWQRLLAIRGIHDDVGWLLRAYFVSYTAGQGLAASPRRGGQPVSPTTPRPP